MVERATVNRKAMSSILISSVLFSSANKLMFCRSHLYFVYRHLATDNNMPLFDEAAIHFVTRIFVLVVSHNFCPSRGIINLHLPHSSFARTTSNSCYYYFIVEKASNSRLYILESTKDSRYVICYCEIVLVADPHSQSFVSTAHPATTRQHLQCFLWGKTTSNQRVPRLFPLFLSDNF